MVFGVAEHGPNPVFVGFGLRVLPGLLVGMLVARDILGGVVGGLEEVERLPELFGYRLSLKERESITYAKLSYM